MKVDFHEIGILNEELLGFVTIAARYKELWIFVKHKERETWEIPGGHIEVGENAMEAARREIFEESGAIEFDIYPICDYSVTKESKVTYGRVFIGEVGKLNALPDFEIGEVRLFDDVPDNLTYPYIYKLLFSFLRNIGA
jgi:8-oxo-dGTP diphosphatase